MIQKFVSRYAQRYRSQYWQLPLDDPDRQIHAFDQRNGKPLWRADLPISGNATPITYMIDGREHVVIATSGGRNPRWPQGSAYAAFALPLVGQ